MRFFDSSYFCHISIKPLQSFNFLASANQSGVHLQKDPSSITLCSSRNVDMDLLFFKIPSFFLLVTSLCFFCSFQSIHSLSTISISNINNQTLICALINSTPSQQPYINCSSFPPGIQIPSISTLQSPSGIVGGNNFFCALSTFTSSSTSILVCWRFSDNPTSIAYKRLYQGPVLNELAAGNSHVCGIVVSTGRLQCWQWTEFNPGLSSSITASVSVGEKFVCGLTDSSQVQCQGTYTNVTERVPVGNYSVVAAGSRHACAIGYNGKLTCWGDDVRQIPTGDFKSLALGDQMGCALTNPNGTVVCWGESGMFNIPESLRQASFLTLESKGEVFCGVMALNLTLYCWGNGNLDTNVPVFNGVLPGPCRNECPCGILPDSARLCGGSQMVCNSCFEDSEEFPSSSEPPLSSQSPSPMGENSSLNGKMVAFLVVGCVGSVSLILVICFFFCRYCNIKGSQIHDSGHLDEAGMPRSKRATTAVLDKRLSQLVSMGNVSSLEDFSLETLIKATDDFSEENKIGSGSFGYVYHGTLEDGREVAVKRAEATTSSSYAGRTKHGEDDKDSAFLSELEFLSRLHHKNLVRLLGYCDESDERVLVYEYINNGTLHDHIHDLESSPLMSWPARIKVALDAARGIEYLHDYAVPPIIHRDIKSSNILLDSTWTAKVSDFGLSLMGPEDGVSHLSLRAAGTVGYMDPEYYRLQHLTKKSDVYSFGVMLLEMLSGQKAIHKNEAGVPRNVVDYMVPYIIQDEIHRGLDRRVPPPTPFEIEGVTYVGYLAVDCVTLEARSRPSMGEIVNSLDTALASCLEIPTFSRSTTDSTS